MMAWRCINDSIISPTIYVEITIW